MNLKHSHYKILIAIRKTLRQMLPQLLPTSKLNVVKLLLHMRHINGRYYKPRETEEIILRSLPNGVCDTFNLQTGELVQRELVRYGSRW